MSDGRLQIFNWDKIHNEGWFYSSSIYNIVNWRIKCIKILLWGLCQYIFSLIKYVLRNYAFSALLADYYSIFPLNLFAYKRKILLKGTFQWRLLEQVLCMVCSVDLIAHLINDNWIKPWFGLKCHVNSRSPFSCWI